MLLDIKIESQIHAWTEVPRKKHQVYIKDSARLIGCLEFCDYRQPE